MEENVENRSMNTYKGTVFEQSKMRKEEIIKLSKRYIRVYWKMEDKIEKSFKGKLLRIKLEIGYDKEGKKVKKIKGERQRNKRKNKMKKISYKSEEWRAWVGR